MAKKAILKDYDGIDILPITRAELILDEQGNQAFRSASLLVTDADHGLMSSQDKTTLKQAVIVQSVQDSVATVTNNNDVIYPKTIAKAVTINNTNLENYLEQKLTLDEEPTKDSTNGVTSGGVYSAIKAIPNTVLSELNLDTQGGAYRYIQSIKQENGVISVTTGGVFQGTNVGLVPSFQETTGSDTKYLRADGEWETPPNTQYSVMSGASSEQDGTSGLVPQPTKDDVNKVLMGNGVWTSLPVLSVTSTGTGNAITGISVVEHNLTLTKGSTFSLSGHTHPTSSINSLNGYTIAAAIGDLSTGDTLNQALGKLEYKANSAYNWIIGVTSDDTDDYINKWWEIVDFIKNVKEDTDADGNPTDILDEFVTRKTDQTITGLKSFTNQVIIHGNAASKPLIVSGIAGSNGNGAVGPLHLQYDVNQPIYLGNEATHTISADGSLYSGTSTYVAVRAGTASVYRAIVVHNGNSLFSAGTGTGKPQYNYSTGDVKAYSFTTDGGNFIGNLTGSANSLSSWSAASSTSTKRYVWMSYNDNSGRACYDADLTYQTDTDTLYTKNITALGNLEVGNTDANHTLALKGSASQLKLFAWGDATYIESGNSNFSANKALKITGIGGTTGSDLYLDFANIYCRDTQSINIDSGNYYNYIKILANYFSKRPKTCDYLFGDGSLRHFKADASDIEDTSKLPMDAHVLHFAWDNDSGWESQLAVSASKTPTIYIRGQATKTWSDWITLLSSNNYTNYTVKKDEAYQIKGLFGSPYDWNDKKTIGTYKVQTEPSYATNLPTYGTNLTAYSYGIAMVLKGLVGDSEDRTAQLYIPHNAKGGVPLYIRMFNSTAWTAWSAIPSLIHLQDNYLPLKGGTLTGSLGLGQYGILGFGASIDSKYTNSATISPLANAVWLATTGGGGESAGIMLDGDKIKLWSPMDSSLLYIDSDNGTSYTILHSGNYTTCVNTTNFPGLHKTGTVTSITLTQGTGITVSSSGTAITTSGSRTISLNAASTTAIGGIQLGYTATGADIPLQTSSSNKGFVALTKSAVQSALGVTINTGTASRIAYYSGSTTISCNSNITIGTNSISCSGGFYETSDERLKDFYDDIKIDFEKLSKLPKKYFKWKQDQSKLNIGTSAQELQKLYPEIVNTDDDGILHVAYDKLSIIALKGIDILYDEIKKLKARIEYLELK